MMKSSNNELQIKAKELVEKHGKGAVEVAQRKVRAFPKDEHCREKDFALMLLSEVENLTTRTNENSKTTRGLFSLHHKLS